MSARVNAGAAGNMMLQQISHTLTHYFVCCMFIVTQIEAFSFTLCTVAVRLDEELIMQICIRSCRLSLTVIVECFCACY